MTPPLTAEQRLAVSRAQCEQALGQPIWLLLAQRVCDSAGRTTGAQSHACTLVAWLDPAIKTLLDHLHNADISERQKDHAQQHG